MADGEQGAVEKLVESAIRLGADTLEVEYQDGCERVSAGKGGAGVSIAVFASSSPEATALRETLYSIAKRKRRVRVEGQDYELRGSVYDSFGEDVFRVELRQISTGA